MRRSQVDQALHYFARPHTGVRRTPVEGAAAWRGDALDEGSWREALAPAEIAELDAAIAHVRELGRPTESLRRSDFPLPGLAARIEGWRETLGRGRGFVVIGGIPVERWSQEEAEVFFWCLGLHLGIPGAQNPQGDLLGHVRDTGVSPGRTVRQYRTSERIDFHCDLADVVGLLCLKQARSGGNSRIASSVSVYNEVLRRRPELVPFLYKPFPMDTRGEGGVRTMPLVPCAHRGGALRTFWHAGYFRSALELPDPPPVLPEQRALLGLYDELLHAPGLALDMELRPGDIQLLSNHTVVHGRTSFEDHDAPEKKRHLLRLWLSLDGGQPVSERALRWWSRMGVLARLARGRVAARFKR